MFPFGDSVSLRIHRLPTANDLIEEREEVPGEVVIGVDKPLRGAGQL
jgi:hypothetical protein